MKRNMLSAEEIIARRQARRNGASDGFRLGVELAALGAHLRNLDALLSGHTIVVTIDRGK